MRNTAFVTTGFLRMRASHLSSFNSTGPSLTIITRSKMEVHSAPKLEYHLRDPLEILGERNFKEPVEIAEDVQGTVIQEFYRDANVLITGGTGFMGKVVTEKLLRSVPHIGHLYLIIRPKKGKGINDRLDEMFEDRLFRRLKKENPKYRSKITPIEGDCATHGIGLTSKDRQLLVDKVNVVFHGAATVRFDEKLRAALQINVIGIREVLTLARDIKNLKSFIHVSTAFANCNHLHIEERFYSTPTKYQEILQLMKTKDEEEFEQLTPSLVADWPNTYTFSKALGENVVASEGQGMPVAVFRPAVVISSYKEPVRGWIDNVYGPIGLLVGAGTGVLHTYLGNQDMVTDMVPVDMAANALIVSAWKTATQKEDKIPIYNYVSSSQNPLPWRDFIKVNRKYGIFWPTVHAIWYYSFMAIQNPILYLIASFFCHTLPGYFLDALASATGGTPRLTKIYKKLDKFSTTMTYFSENEWTFENYRTQDLWNNLSPEDQEIFFFDMAKMDWDYHAQSNCLGLRVYLLKDDVHTLPQARKKWQRLFLAHCALKLFVTLLALKLAWMLIKLLLTVLL